MNRVLIIIIIKFIKFYKYVFSPLLGDKCRYLPSCSEYFIEALKVHGLGRGLIFGIKRILVCHPFKFLGGGSGLDFVPNKKEKKNG